MKKILVLLFLILTYSMHCQDGTLDSTFNEDGLSTFHFGLGGDCYGDGVALQNDGKLLQVGIANNGELDLFGVLRINSDGTLDSTFSDDGMTTIEFPSADYSRAKKCAIQNDGKIVIVGDYSCRNIVYFG